ncbi:MAG TPA: peptidylprolyl isomerase [Gammaproteobacteria bacterium]|nr:peptidylprolyl isomerase [Gammaproteobacteria bacterium]
MQNSALRLPAVLVAVLLLCQACASTPKANPNISPTAVMNPAPAAASVTAAAITKASSTGVLLDRVVAVVNDQVILQSELAIRVAAITRQIQAQGTALPPENILRKQVLDEMILTKLELQQAASKGISVSDDTLNQAINRIAERNGITFNQLPEKLQQQGIDYTDFRQELRNQLIIHNLQRQLVNDQMHITPREIQAQIEMDAANGNANNQYHISQILITLPSDPSTEQVAEARKKAQDIYQQLKNGADFAAMAVEYSQGQQALKGGDLGWRKGSELPTIFADVIRQMHKGDVTEPLSSPSGLHILKLDDVKRTDNKVLVNQTHARHILLRPSAIMTDAQAQAKLKELRKEILAGADFSKLAIQYSEDPGSASNGGDLGWLDPGATVPEFQSQMDKLQAGQISEPFKTQFGWHIVQVLGRRQVDQTQEYIRNKAYEAIYARKSEEIIQNWTTALRGSAYIETFLDK